MYRLPLLQDLENDHFLPHYKLACALPDIPIKSKLFRHKIDLRKSQQYELSSVELNHDRMIYVDYNMGMDLDLIDRDVYLPFPKA